jgi:hypothetical protein
VKIMGKSKSTTTPNREDSTPAQIRKAWNPPCSPEEFAEIVAKLRTLARMDSSLDRTRPPGVDLWPATTPVRNLVASVDESLGHVNGRLLWGEEYAKNLFDNEARLRTLDRSELTLAAIMQSTLDLVLTIRLGGAPPDCGPKLSGLADEMERAACGKKSDERESQRTEPMTWQGKALAAMFEHRDWKAKKIAYFAGVSRAALYGDKDVGPAVKARNKWKRTPDKTSAPRGERNLETGQIDAIDYH